MQPKKYNIFQNESRRRFINNTIKLTVLGTVLGPLQACNNNKSTEPSQPDIEKKKPVASNKKRKQWTHEALVINSKTGVMHFPTSKVYRYYDEIKPAHLKPVIIGDWMNQLQEPVRLNKQQSGTIAEILTMQALKGNLTSTAFIVAVDTLSTAFQPAYEKENTLNFRLHELMLQLVTLNNAIPADQKWLTFNSKVKKPPQLRKRQKWMETESAFNERVNYILNHQDDYLVRLSNRAAKYSFS
ncbi:MAG TPA: hypothetical protein VGO58_11750 [Chitinophagaceae bacterium]|jgi:hypothetical protein|nr:hypothetical protein [Chitinophagaceae bacterium]